MEFVHRCRLDHVYDDSVYSAVSLSNGLKCTKIGPRNSEVALQKKTRRRVTEIIPVSGNSGVTEVRADRRVRSDVLSSGAAGPLAARGGGQICRSFVLGFGNWRACLKYKSML